MILYVSYCIFSSAILYLVIFSLFISPLISLSSFLHCNLLLFISIFLSLLSSSFLSSCLSSCLLFLSIFLSLLSSPLLFSSCLLSSLPFSSLLFPSLLFSSLLVFSLLLSSPLLSSLLFSYTPGRGLVPQDNRGGSFNLRWEHVHRIRQFFPSIVLECVC